MTRNQIRIYGFRPFDRSAKIRWLLTEMGVAFEEHWLNGEKNEAEQPEFLKLNPMGRVPVAQIGDRAMFESSAICAYLADIYLEKGLAPQITDPERADYQKWMYFACVTLDQIQARIMIIEDIPAGEVQKSKESALQAELQGALEALDQAVSRRDYLVGNKFSTADICVAYHLYWLKLWPELESVMKPFARVNTYAERIQARPAAAKVGAFSYEA